MINILLLSVITERMLLALIVENGSSNFPAAKAQPISHLPIVYWPLAELMGFAGKIICNITALEEGTQMAGAGLKAEVLLACHAYLCAFNMGVNINASYLGSLLAAVGVFG